MSPPPPAGGREAEARIEIDAALETAGWVVQNREEMNLFAAQGVAVREFKLKQGHGYADYLLFVDGKAVGVLEAKAPGHTLISVEPQSTKYASGLPDGLDPPILPLPFLYLSTGAVTKFTNLLDPEPRSRFIFHVHRPETLAEWLSAPTLDTWVRANGAYTGGDDTRPSSLRARLRAMPELEPGGLYPNQIQAITNLEASMRQDKPRALLQMATGSGKTLTSVAEIYRLIKFGGARRVLFLVDRSNLGEQAEKEFQNFETPDDHRKFTELYNVQRLTSNTVDAASRVVITTIQRLYSMLKGEDAFEEPEGDEAQLDDSDSLTKEAIPVAFNATIPPEYFDVIFIDECHRSIYSLWRQVLEYFDAFLIGLTATPAKHTFGFFKKNLVMEYGHEQAVVDGVNVDFEIYKIRTKITEGGSTIDTEDGTMIGLRDRRTRKVRWETPDDVVTYTATDLDRNVVAKDQIRLVVRTFRDKVLQETFHGRKELPKTLIQDPAKLCRLIVDLIGNEDWPVMSADVKGDAYEGLLEKNAQDVKGGAGQYFTPRSVIQAMVDCLQPRTGEVIYDPACGTGGFLLSAHDYIAGHGKLDRDQKNHLRYKALRGVELVDGVSRLCAMNLFLHGVGPDDNEREPPIRTEDALRNEPSEHADVVLTNPPFGKKSSITVVNEEGDTDREALVYNRPDFWVTTSNKQLNFVQHVKSLLKVHGRAGVVLPDNVLFEGGAGETVRRKLLHECDLHTILRLPTGIFYAQGVKANVLFFDRKPGSDKPWTKKVWVYDHRTNCHYTLKTKAMTRANLDDFVACYRPGDIHNRKQTWSEKKNPEGRWRSFTFDEIAARDKCSLDLFWLRDESLEDSASLPEPHVLAQEIADDLRSALGQIEDILGDLETRAAKGPRQQAP